MSTSIEAQGHTVDEAIQIALNQLGVSRDKVEIDILHHPRRGVLGIGARRAKVRATIREAVMPDGEEFDMSGGAGLDDKPRRRRRRGGRGRGRGEEGPEQTQRPAGRAEERRSEPDRRGGGREGQQQRGREEGGREQRGEGGRSRDEGGRRDDRRGGRGREQRQEGQGPRVQGQNRDQNREQGQGRGQREGRRDDRRDGRGEGQRDNQQRGERRDGRDQRDQRDRGPHQNGRRDRDQNERRERGPRPEPAAAVDASAEPTSFELADGAPTPDTASPDLAFAPAPAPRRAPAEPEPPLDAQALDAIRARAEELVRELLEKMGFPAEVSSSIDEAAGEAVVSVRSESEGLLIGRRGQTLDSLEHIVNRMTLRADAYVEGRVLLDIGDYRKRRRESLDELAQRLRARAVTERRTVQVSPMSPRDRKFFAQVFAGDEAVEVRALGAGFYRRVIVAPAGAGHAAIAEAETASEVEDDSLEHETFTVSEAES